MTTNINTSSIETQRQIRIQKMETLRAIGVDPFPPTSSRDFTLLTVKTDFENLKDSGRSVTLAGRIKSKRGSGKIAFTTIEDESLPQGFQFVFRKDQLPQGNYNPETEPNPSDQQKYLSSDGHLTFKAFQNLLDEGDYIQAKGQLDLTIAGEPSLFVEQFHILTKSLRPLPDTIEYENMEARYLDRVADFKYNTKDENGLPVREMIRLKSIFWQIWREEMLQEGFLEIETPVFKLTPSGAEAKPFITYYNDLDQDVYLRMELELAQKKLVAGGFEAVFEIGPIFRNEGSSPQHLQEYTQIEWYKAYTDYNYNMNFMKRVFQRLARTMLGGEIQTDYYGNQINWGDWCTPQDAEKNNWELIGGWPKIKYFDAVRYFSGGKIDTENKTDSELVELCHQNGITEAREELGTATLLDKLWKIARLNTTNPFFLYLPPVELEPLAKRNRTNPKLTERFQIVAGRAELGKGFSELNDPIDQFRRFETQQAARDAGNEEAMALDRDYVKSMEYGMPPMSGWGSSERLFSFFFGKHIKECVTFPHVRANETPEKNLKETKVFNIVLVKSESIQEWQKLNAVAHLTGSVIAHNQLNQEVLDLKEVSSSDSEKFPMDLRWGVHLKQTYEKSAILDLFRQAKDKQLYSTIFASEFFSARDDLEAVKNFGEKTSNDLDWIGVLIYGKKSEVEKLTQDFARFE